MLDTTYVILGHFQPFHNGHVEAVRYISQQKNAKRIFFLVQASDISGTLTSPFPYEFREQLIRAYLSSDDFTSLFPSGSNPEVSVLPVTSQIESFAMTPSVLVPRVLNAAGFSLDSDPRKTCYVVTSSAQDSECRESYLSAGFNVAVIHPAEPRTSYILRDMILQSLAWRCCVPSCVAALLDAKNVERMFRRKLAPPARKVSPSTADIIIEQKVPGAPDKMGIVLVRRKNPPLGWATPGGFVEYGEDVWDAARREANEETGMVIKKLYLLDVRGTSGRDPRAHAISSIFIARWNDVEGEAVGADDAEKAEVFTEDTLPDDIAFDHRSIIKEYFDIVKSGTYPPVFREFFSKL